MNRRNLLACLVGAVVLKTADALGVVSEKPAIEDIRRFYRAYDPLPPRFNYVVGKWTQVFPFSVLKEDGAMFNPEYETATYEDSVWVDLETKRGQVFRERR